MKPPLLAASRCLTGLHNGEGHCTKTGRWSGLNRWATSWLRWQHWSDHTCASVGRCKELPWEIGTQQWSKKVLVTALIALLLQRNRQWPGVATQVTLTEFKNTERVCEERKVMVKRIARYIDGTVFGNPNRKLQDQSVIIRNVSHDQLLEVERRCSMPEKLALGLLQLLFTPEELKSGNCTKSIRSDIEQLDTKRLRAIKYKV